MKVYNYSEARQNFAMLFNTSLNEDVVIKRKDGSRFKLVPIIDKNPKSPFDIDGIEVDIIRDARSGDREY